MTKQQPTQRLASTEMVSISFPSAKEENPWLKFGGVFKNDPDFENIVQDMKIERIENWTNPKNEESL